MSASRHKHLLNELRRLLEEQIESARQGKLGRIETLSEKTGRITEEIARAGILKRPEYAEQRERLGGLYEDLKLTLSDQRDEVGRELNKIRKGKKTIGAYRRGIQTARWSVVNKVGQKET